MLVKLKFKVLYAHNITAATALKNDFVNSFNTLCCAMGDKFLCEWGLLKHLEEMTQTENYQSYIVRGGRKNILLKKNEIWEQAEVSETMLIM